VLFGRGRAVEGEGLKDRREVIGECKGFLSRAPCPRPLRSAEGRGWLSGVFEVFGGFP
jgi:hypothetical protein